MKHKETEGRRKKIMYTFINTAAKSYSFGITEIQLSIEINYLTLRIAL